MIILLRFLIVIVFTFIGYYFGLQFLAGALLSQYPWLGALIGALAGLLIILIDLYFKHLSVKNILSVLIGTALGL